MSTPWKRRLLIAIACLLAVPLLAWGGFRAWLATLPTDFRAQIEQYSTLEFLGVLHDMVRPPSVEDRGAWGRFDVPGRGDSPWVRRHSLDGRPRMLSAALAPGIRLAYGTESASVHMLWRGAIDFAGPVYDARHGREPRSTGVAWWRPGSATVWQVEVDGAFQPAAVQWRGHGFDPDAGALWMRFDLLVEDGDADFARVVRTVTERPELEGDPASAGVTLERRFVFTTPAGAAPTTVALARPVHDGRLEVGGDAALTPDRVVFAASAREARLVHRFGAPEYALDAPVEPAEASPFADEDCLTCHGERERVVGPAWSEIAARHASANRAATVERLAARILEGSSGEWSGGAVMPPHPHLAPERARAFAAAILETEPAEAPVIRVETGGAAATWTFRSETDPAPTALHPSLRTTPLDPPGFTPMVGGLAWLPDGRLAVSTWDPDGALFAIDGWRGDAAGVEITRIAEGLHEPLGLATLDDALYVMQKQEITRLLDHDGDGRIDEYRTVANDWTATSNFHEFGFGLVAHAGRLYASLSACVLVGGKSCRAQSRDRGSIVSVEPDTAPDGRPRPTTRVARGFRTPNGLGLSPEGALFVTDNQGDWLPASTLARIEPGAHYGWRGPEESIDAERVVPPALWLPHNEVGNSPTQPLFLEHGPYAGQVVFGDIYNGGLKRGALERVEGVDQGAVFHFSGGFEGPIHRLLATPDGRGFVVGEIGSHGNWAEPGKEHWGLERVDLGEEAAFEPLRVAARPGGFRIDFTRPLAGASAEALARAPASIAMSDWFYVRAPIYGGPKYDVRTLSPSAVRVASDRRSIEVDVPELAAGRVVYLALPRALRSEAGDALWVREAWYTLNRLPGGGDGAPPDEADAANRLTEAERAAGWRLLFDGQSFEGWKVYGSDEPISHWVIDDGALHFTRDVSFAGLVWNHVNPFAQSAVDLMTRERFGDFELSIDWRISPGGNSGIFYAVPDESTPLSWDLGLEMQVLDDAGHYDGEIDRHRAGDLYDLQSLATGAARAVGEWNRARIRVEGDRVRHWLNDVLVADIVRGSPEWDAAIARSKFDGTPGFGRARTGHITLQDHGDPVWYRNVKILPLDARGTSGARP